MLCTATCLALGEPNQYLPALVRTYAAGFYYFVDKLVDKCLPEVYFMILKMAVSVRDWDLFPGHFPVTVSQGEIAPDNNPSFTLYANDLNLVSKEGKLSFCHGRPTKLGKLDKFFINQKKACTSYQTCLICCPGTWFVVIIEYLQLLHTKWGVLLHYSVCLL